MGGARGGNQSTRDSRAPSLVTVPSSTSMSDVRSRGNTTSTVGGGAPLAPPSESPTFTRAATAAAAAVPATPGTAAAATAAPAEDDRAGADMGRSESQRYSRETNPVPGSSASLTGLELEGRGRVDAGACGQR